MPSAMQTQEQPMHKYAYLESGRYARGWHIMLLSQEISVGEVKKLH